MLGIALYCLLIASPRIWLNCCGDAFATLGYVANWHEVFAKQSYFNLFAAPSPLNHTWSLAIEEQFYLLWPLIVVGALAFWKRRTANGVLAVSLVLAAVSTVLMFAFYDPNNVSRDYFGTDTRVAAILFGAALAAWLAGHEPARRRGSRVALEVVALAGVVILALAWTRLDGQSSTLYHGGFLVCGLAATAVIAAAVHPQRGPVSWALSWRPLCALGLISYGVYLYHWPIDVAFDQKQMGFGGWPLFVFQTGLTIFLAILSYRFIEQPIRHGAGTSIQWRKLVPAIAAALAVLLAVSTANAQPLQKVSILKNPLRAATQAYNDAPPGAERVMIVGDSVAFFLAQAAQNVTVSRPLAIFNAGVEGCGFPTGVTRAKYHSSNGVKLNWVKGMCDPPWEDGAIQRFKPTLVFWVVSGPADAMQYGGHWYDTCSSAWAPLYERALKHEIARLQAGGAKVVLTNAVYPRYLFADSDRDTDCENQLRNIAVQDTGAQLIDLNGYICPNRQCRTTQNGVVLRVDGEHFKGPGGRMVFKWLYNGAKQ
jgi:peptidoglycan/LPS O-acetylase OafA/YrhL